MKTKFKHFYPNYDINSSNIGDDNVLVCLDANVLLNIYRYSNKIKNKLIEGLQKQPNLFIPYNAAFEFNYNKKTVLNSILKQKQILENEFKKFKNNNIKTFNSIWDDNKLLKCNESKEVIQEIKKKYNNSIGNLEDEILNEYLKTYYELYDNLSSNDSISNDLANLLEGHVGNPYDLKSMHKILESAKIRFENNVPPGLDDRDKNKTYTYFFNNDMISFENKYSDYIVWKQIIDYVCKNTDKFNSVLFITDDNTDDWIYRLNGKQIGIRAELRNEFFDLTGKYIKIVNTNTYLQYFFNDSELNIISSEINNETVYSIEKKSQSESEESPDYDTLKYFNTDLKLLKTRLYKLEKMIENETLIFEDKARYYNDKTSGLLHDLNELSTDLNYAFKYNISPNNYLSISLELDNIEQNISDIYNMINSKVNYNIPF